MKPIKVYIMSSPNQNRQKRQRLQEGYTAESDTTGIQQQQQQRQPFPADWLRTLAVFLTPGERNKVRTTGTELRARITDAEATGPCWLRWDSLLPNDCDNPKWAPGDRTTSPRDVENTFEVTFVDALDDSYAVNDKITLSDNSSTGTNTRTYTVVEAAAGGDHVLKLKKKSADALPTVDFYTGFLNFVVHVTPDNPDRLLSCKSWCTYRKFLQDYKLNRSTKNWNFTVGILPESTTVNQKRVGKFTGDDTLRRLAAVLKLGYAPVHGRIDIKVNSIEEDVAIQEDVVGEDMTLSHLRDQFYIVKWTNEIDRWHSAFEALAGGVQVNPHIVALNISDFANHIAELQHPEQFLYPNSVNSTLEKLELTNCDITAQRVSAIADRMMRGVALNWLNLDSNPIGNEGSDHIVRIIRNGNLQSLSVARTHLTDGSLLKIARAARTSSGLTHLNIAQMGPMDTATVAELVRTLLWDSSLTDMHVGDLSQEQVTAVAYLLNRSKRRLTDDKDNFTSLKFLTFTHGEFEIKVHNDSQFASPKPNIINYTLRV